MTRHEAIEILQVEHHWCQEPCYVIKALEMAILALTIEPIGEPLTLEQLRNMDGHPAYWKDDDSFGIISVDSCGRWNGIPFFPWKKNGANFEYDIISRGMSIYCIKEV